MLPKVAIQEDEIDTIRAAGVEALGAVLQLLLQRDPANKRVTYYTLIWKHIKKRLPPTALVKLDNGLSYTTTQLSTWQGSLLVLGELLDRNNGSNRFMLPRFTVVSGVVLSFTKAGFTTPIYEAVVRLASRLAQVSFHFFSIFILMLMFFFLVGSSWFCGKRLFGEVCYILNWVPRNDRSIVFRFVINRSSHFIKENLYWQSSCGS